MKLCILICAVILLVGATGSIFFLRSSEATISPAPDFDVPTPFLNLISRDCPNDTNVSDRFVCVAAASKVTLAEVDALADTLIAESPKRLKELASEQDSPTSWEPGGELFLEELPESVGAAQSARDAYINAVCKLDAMQIYGSSGMDLEREACRYYYAQQFLQTLKNLETTF